MKKDVNSSNIIDVEPIKSVMAEKTEDFPALKASQEDQIFKEKAMILAKSGLVPDHLQGEWKKIMVIFWYGRMLQLDPMQALQDIYVINGIPTMSTKLMKALVHKRMPKAVFKIEYSDENECRVIAGRDKDSTSVYRFTYEKAERAGITHRFNKFKQKSELKENWQKWREEMLRWRCIAQAFRIEFYDVIQGIAYSPEEIYDGEVNQSGEPIFNKEKGSHELAHEMIKNKYK